MPSERPDHASGSKAWSHIIVALVGDVDRWPRDRIFAIASSVRGPRGASTSHNRVAVRTAGDGFCVSHVVALENWLPAMCAGLARTRTVGARASNARELGLTVKHLTALDSARAQFSRCDVLRACANGFFDSRARAVQTVATARHRHCAQAGARGDDVLEARERQGLGVPILGQAGKKIGQREFGQRRCS